MKNGKIIPSVERWATRAKMGEYRVWAIVEGKNHDIPFYEGILRKGARLKKVQLLQASQIEIEDSQAGGKHRTLRIFEEVKNLKSLSQRNKKTKVDFVFFVDRDDDEYLRKLVSHDHLIYTQNSDVEAEIVAHCSTVKAVSTAFSVSRSTAKEFAVKAPNDQLAKIWDEWIAMRLAAARCDWRGQRFAQTSAIHMPLYGKLDLALHKVLDEAATKAQSARWVDAILDARDYVQQAIRQGTGGTLVKGKWLAGYISSSFLENVTHLDVRKPKNDELMVACLSQVDFTNAWDAYYEAQLSKVLR